MTGKPQILCQDQVDTRLVVGLVISLTLSDCRSLCGRVPHRPPYAFDTLSIYFLLYSFFFCKTDMDTNTNTDRNTNTDVAYYRARVSQREASVICVCVCICLCVCGGILAEQIVEDLILGSSRAQ